MFTKLDPFALSLLACPLCKEALSHEQGQISCLKCRTAFTTVAVDTGNGDEQIYDLRMPYPDFAVPVQIKDWNRCQQHYEIWNDQQQQHAIEYYRSEIESVAEIYQEEFDISGSVLDVGGHQGRLRHFLGAESLESYVSLDPFPHVFKNISKQSSLLQAYSCLSKPCNFLTARAEELPFKSNSFDCVHMRSVLDHFYDPYRALKEALRVLKPQAHLLLGVSVGVVEDSSNVLRTKVSQLSKKIQQEGLAATSKKIMLKSAQLLGGSFLSEHDPHIFHFNYQELLDLVEKAGFKITKLHRQKPPYEHCLYLSASKPD
jgi:ubiquinone/menaquinone biosynthesis C-methylase UbiE